MPDTHAVKHRRTEIEGDSQRQMLVQERQHSAICGAHCPEFQKDGAERTDHRTEKDDQDRTERSAVHFLAPWPSTATPIMMLTMPINLEVFRVSLKMKYESAVTQT